MADLLDKTARQVRLPGGFVHRMVSNKFALPSGRCYRTRCGRTMTGQQGAVLTTRDVECADCLANRPVGQGVREMVDAILGDNPGRPS